MEQRGLRSRSKRGKYFTLHFTLIKSKWSAFVFVPRITFYWLNRLNTIFRTGKMDDSAAMPPPKYSGSTNTLGGFIRKAQRTLLNTPWQIIQVYKNLFNSNFLKFFTSCT